MSDWYFQVTEKPDDLSPLVECLAWFENEYNEAKKDIEVKGSLERDATKIPGQVEHRWSQLQELEALVIWVESEVKKVRVAAFKKYLENYPRDLSSRDALLYAEVEPQVLEMAELQNQICLMRNKFMGIMTGLRSKEFQISNIVKLKVAGLDDAYLNY